MSAINFLVCCSRIIDTALEMSVESEVTGEFPSTDPTADFLPSSSLISGIESHRHSRVVSYLYFLSVHTVVCAQQYYLPSSKAKLLT